MVVRMMKKLRERMKWIMALIVVAFLLSTFLMYEGRSSRRSPGRNPDGTMTDYEVAQINGRSLMRSELERGLRSVLENIGRRDVTSLDMPALYQAVLDQYVLDSQMSREVEARGIRISDAEADQAMKAYADQYYPTREAFYQTLQMAGVKLDDYKKDIARQMAQQQLYREAIGDVAVSEDAAVRFYDATRELFFRTPEGFRVHFATYNNREDAEALHTRLSAGEGWEQAVSDDRLTSQDAANITQEPVFLPTSAFESGMFSPLASLDVGQVSTVFPISSDDFAVGLKVEHVEESVRSYDTVSADIRVMLREQETQQRLAAFQRELMEKAQLVVYDTSLFPQPNAEPNDAEPVNPEPPAEPVAEEPTTPAAEPTAQPAVNPTEGPTTPAAEPTAQLEPAPSTPEATPTKPSEAEPVVASPSSVPEPVEEPVSPTGPGASN